MKIDLTPSTNIFNTYKNIKYTPASALNEYFDNSTSSFFEHGTKNDDRRIIVVIDRREKGKEKLHIVDNAFGMNEENFIRAVKIDDKKKETERNKFGVGLKVSAIWYSDVWTIETLEYGTNKFRKFKFDLKEVQASDGNEYDAEVSDKQRIGGELGFQFESGTIITLMNPRELPTSKVAVEKIVKNISSSFSHDIADENVKFQICEMKTTKYGGIEYLDLVAKYFGKNGEKQIKQQTKNLKAVEPETKEWKIIDGKECTVDISFQLTDPDDENKIYNVSGTMGWITDSGMGKGGIKRLWKNRALEPQLWADGQIFGKQNTYVAQRLYGELDFTDFETSNSKDSFLIKAEVEEQLVIRLSNELAEIKKLINKLSKEEAKKKKELRESRIEESFINNVDPVFDSDKKLGQKVKNEIVDDSKVKTETILKIGDKTVNVKTILSDEFDNDSQLIRLKNQNDEEFIYEYEINMNHKIIKSASEDNIDNITKLIYLVCRSEMEARVDFLINNNFGWFKTINKINDLFDVKEEDNE